MELKLTVVCLDLSFRLVGQHDNNMLEPVRNALY